MLCLSIVNVRKPTSDPRAVLERYFVVRDRCVCRKLVYPTSTASLTFLAVSG